MAEHMLALRKETGGATLICPLDGETYTWAKDGDVTEVPYEWGLTLLAIRSGGFSVADEKQAQKAADGHTATLRSADQGHDDAEQHQVLEPAPGKALEDRIVSEPAPAAGDAVAEGSQAPESGDGSPVTPKPRAGTRTRK